MISDIISLVFILPGAFMVFSAAVGTARFNSTLARVHAITKPQTTGLVLMITGTVIRVTTSDGFGVHEKGDMGMMLLLVVFALMTSPVTAQRLGRIDGVIQHGAMADAVQHLGQRRLHPRALACGQDDGGA